MLAAEANGHGSFADAWHGPMADAVTKCGRESERKLYVYGISSSRCPKCRARLKNDSDTCSSCRYVVKIPRKCLRCSQKNTPVMWCVECDAYFCASCHKKPHVLMLGSSKPHNCFVIDGASGKQFAEASWANEYVAMVQALYRTRVQESKMAKEQAASAVAGDKARVQARTEGPAPQQASENGSHSVTSNGPGKEASSTSTSVAGERQDSVSMTVDAQARKRQLPEPVETSDRAVKTPRSQTAVDGTSQLSENDSTSQPNGVGTASRDGMSLYDRVRAMHDKRAKVSQEPSPSAKLSVDRLLARSEQQEKPQQVQGTKEQQQTGEERERIVRVREQLRQQGRELVERAKKKQQQEEQHRQKKLKEKQRQEELKEQQRQEELNEQQRQEEQERANRLQQTMRLEELERIRQHKLHMEKRQQENERQQRLLRERIQHDEILRQQDEERRHQQQAQAHVMPPHPVVQECSRYVTQAQQVLQTQPGFVVTSMAPPSNPAFVQQTASPRFTRIPSPVANAANAFPHAQQQYTSPHAQQHASAQAQHHFQSPPNLFPAAYVPPVSSGFAPTRNEQYPQGHPSQFDTAPQEGHRDLVVRDPNVQRQQQQYNSVPSDAVIPRQRTPPVTPTSVVEDDELRGMWVNDYDNINAVVVKRESEIAKLTEEGHAFVHRSNNITIPEQLQQQISQLRAQRDRAIEARFKSVVRVLIFSAAVRSFAQQNEHTNIWSDVPEVLKASHKKCAELASDIREYERQAQTLRDSIDEAVSSGDPSKMQNVAQLGAHIAGLEKKINVANAERDKQFTFMFQFSEAVRAMVRDEWNRTGTSSAVSYSQ